MKKIILRTRLSHIAYLLLVVVFISCENKIKPDQQTNTRRICKVLKSKHFENRSTNLRGDFEVVHYFLYEDGALEEVSIKEFMSFNISDTICWNE